MVNSPMNPLSSGMPERTEADDQVDRGEVRHGRRQAAEFGNQPRVPALVQDADDQEQRAGGDSVVDLLDACCRKDRWV